MIITDHRTSNKLDKQAIIKGDILNIKKFNSLPSPVTALLIGGGEYWIETLCVQTGAMRIDVCGMIDFSEFIMVKNLIDSDGNEHNPEDFWIE